MVFSWRLRSPGALMAAAVAVCAIFVVGTTWVAVDQPWLGLRLAPDEGGARIVAVNRAGVSDHLRAGERLVAVGGASQPVSASTAAAAAMRAPPSMGLRGLTPSPACGRGWG